MTSRKESIALNKITGFCKNNSRMIFLGIILLLNCFVFSKNYSDKSTDSQKLLLLSYQDIGFSSRIFLGTLLRLLGFSNNRLDKLNNILFITYLIVSALFFLVMVQTVRNDKTRKSHINKMSDIEPWYVYLYSCPIFLYGFSYNLYGSVNIFLVLLTLICFLLFQNQKATFLIPILCILAIFTDHIFSLIYLPVLCLLLWHKSKSRSGKAFSVLLKITLVFSILTTILMICFSFKPEFSIYYYNTKMFSVNNFHFLEDLTQICSNHKIGFKDEILWLLITSPVIVFLVYLWMTCLKISKKKNIKFFKFCFVHLALCLPSIIYFKGFRSWLTSTLIAQILLVFGLLSQNDKTVKKVFDGFNLYIKKNPIILFIFIFTFYFLLSVFLTTLNLN